ncbi:MAG: response regulator transcription factor [Chloroflexi bacterium]|jgi:DNA-binding response OmpR family regulator|nr:response regulator transcription factor [Chloroflexota bacterium]MBT7082261.1 response regulator transcription factor [Chloroflexota bacterium]MBT7289552.1 response regulator transcription factor [Chloroflexota bacterium]
MKALIIDDAPDLIELVSLCFKLRWPEADIVTSMTGEKGVELVESERPDMIILDIGLPDIDGFEVLRRIRLFSDAPVILLTVRGKELDILKGFELGADDYITKPFSQVGLLARVKAVLRRSKTILMEENSEPFKSNDLYIDYAARQVIVNGQELKLTPIEYGLLYHLSKNPGRVMSHSELLRKAQGPEYVEATENLKVYIQRLRRKIEEDASNPKLILTERGVGYIFAKHK